MSSAGDYACPFCSEWDCACLDDRGARYDGCPDCGEYDCMCVEDFDDPDDRDAYITGWCDECEAWGDWQCRIHGDAVIEAMRAEHEGHAVDEAVNTLLACPDAGHGAAWQELQRAARRYHDGQTADAVAVLDPDAAQLAAIVAEFSGWMVAELHANASKGPPRSWRAESRAWALCEVERHALKLRHAVERGDAARIREHAADVANCALMCADVCGLVTTPDPRDAQHREGDAAHYGGGSE